MNPIYLQVADELEAHIVRRRAGTKLPSENELARQHCVSRLTARAALEELERRYLVRRGQGKRTRVARRVDYLISPQTPPSWSETVRLGGGVPRSETERVQLRRPPEAIRRALALVAGAPVLLLQRRRFVDDELAAVADTWLNPELVPMLAARLGGEGSLHRAFASVYRLAPRRADVRAEFIVAPPAIARRLACESRPMVLRLSGSTASAKAARTIEFTTSWLRADIFNVVFALGPSR